MRLSSTLSISKGLESPDEISPLDLVNLDFFNDPVKQPTLKNPGNESKPKAFIDNAPYPKWIKSRLRSCSKTLMCGQ